MPTQGPLFPGTTADDATVGTVVWSTTDNIKVDDGSTAGAALLTNAPNTSHYLTGTNFGFTVPAGSTILGIQVEWKRTHVGGAGHDIDNSAKIIQDSVIGGTEKSVGAVWTDSSLQYDSFGGAADLWGLAWTVAQINSSGFGAALSATGQTAAAATATVDALRITVTYSAGVSAGPGSGGFPADQNDPALTGVPALAPVLQQITRGRAGSRYRGSMRH